jgi:hypothetical protein
MGVLTGTLKERARGGLLGLAVAPFFLFGLAVTFAGVFTTNEALRTEGTQPVWAAIKETASLWPLAFAVFSVGFVAVLAATLVIGMTTLASGAAPKAQFLWLRRFHVETPPRYPISRLLEELNFAGAHGWTLRDSRVRSSSKAIADAFARAAGENRIVMALVWLFWLLVAVTGFATLISPSNPAFFTGLRHAALFIIGIVGLAAAAMAIAGVVGMAGARRVELTEESLFNRIVARHHKLAHRPSARSAGITVFATPDNLWKKAVRLVLERVDFILLDATDMSENIAFELEVIQDLKLESRLFLLVMEGDDRRLSQEASAILEQYFGREWLHSAPVYAYPRQGRLRRQDRGRLAAFIEQKLFSTHD